MSRPIPDRPPFTPYSLDQTNPPSPPFTPGSGASTDDWKQHKTLSIDPYSEGRTTFDNYRLLISGIVPRPIGFVSTVSAAGAHNLAPFSYLSLANHDPPILTLGFSAGQGDGRDTCAHLLETGECTINIISESFITAANYTSIDTPRGVSEWALSGLTQAASAVVKPPRVAESVFSVEAKLRFSHEWTSHVSGNKTGTLVILEGVWFHAREDAVLEKGVLDLNVLKPVSRLGGISYGRTKETFELARPQYEDEKQGAAFQAALAREQGEKGEKGSAEQEGEK